MPPLRSLHGRLNEKISVRAAGVGKPYLNLLDGHELSGGLEGAPTLVSTLSRSQAHPRSLASADFDEDGIPDLISAYGDNSGRGVISLHRGNIDSIYPNSPEAQARRITGEFTNAPFLSPGRVFGLTVTPDFLGAGDFDADGHVDVVAASRGHDSLFLLSGDGRGSLRVPRERKVPGFVTALATGEINRADGLVDLIVGVAGGHRGAQLLVFEDQAGALYAEPQLHYVPSPVVSLAMGHLDGDNEIDLVAAFGKQLMIMHGHDRRSLARETKLSPTARVDVRSFLDVICDVTIGDFTDNQRSDIAFLDQNGRLRLLSSAELKHSLEASLISWRTKLLAESLPSAARVTKVKMSSLSGDNLMLLGRDSHQIHLVSPRAEAGHPGRLLALNTESVPVAALPLRLNSDALDDLVLLQSGKSAPDILLSAPVLTFVVNTTTDNNDGTCDAAHCSLREAVTAVESNPGADMITFSIGTGAKTIALGLFLPQLYEPVTIDATTQPGFAGQPLIELDGTNCTVDFPAFAVRGGNSTVRGFVINRFHSNGLSIFENGGSIIEGNYIGTDITGTVDLGNDFRGVEVGEAPPEVHSANNRIGGTVAQARNLISGNQVHGIRIIGTGSSGNVVQGNLIGTNVNGTSALGNGFEGIFIAGGRNNNIGGTVAGARNVISGNGVSGNSRTAGLAIAPFPSNTGASGNLVQGNLFGTDITGTARIANANEGVLLDSGATNNTIGGSVDPARNIISGNGTNGIDVGFSLPVTLNVVQGNYIGTDISGNLPLGNSLHGIFINVNSVDNLIKDNRIAFNGGNGIHIPNVTPDPGNPGVRISLDSNFIYSNGGLGIDLGEPGVTANDIGDTDVGANLQQNFPMLTDFLMQGPVALSPEENQLLATINVNGTLNSAANTSYTVHWYFSNTSQCTNNQSNTRPLVTGRVPGVTTNASGNAGFNFAFTFPQGISAGIINCTATDSQGNTSEFSACFAVSETPPPPSVQFSSASYTSTEGTPSATVTVTRTGSTVGESFVTYATSDGVATERKDYTAALGRLRFAPGETSKSFEVLITDDRFDDDAESFNLALSTPVGATLGAPNTATVVITDNDTANSTSPVRDGNINPAFFVRQHYADFLGRVPDQGGLDFWVDKSTNCGESDVLVCRLNVSAAFFLSIEFQESGYLVHRTHKVAFGNLPNKPVPLTLREFLAGSRQIGDGVQVGVGNWEQQLEANKVLFFNEFVLRDQFTNLYGGMPNAQYVAALNQNTTNALSQTEQDNLVTALNTTMTRAQVLRAVAENTAFATGPERNRAFVLAQYFGYLRRNPDEVDFRGEPDPNFLGYNFWLDKLNQFNGNFIHAEMVKAFLQSIEYVERFGQ